MGQIHKGLHHTLEAAATNFIEQHRHNHRHKKSEYQTAQTNGHRIADSTNKLFVGKQGFEIGPANPVAAQNALAVGKFFKRQLHAVHWHVLENDEVN